MAKSTKEYITRGKGKSQDKILTSWLCKHSEETAIKLMPNVEENRMRGMYKEANGLSVPKHAEPEKKEENDSGEE